MIRKSGCRFSEKLMLHQKNIRANRFNLRRSRLEQDNDLAEDLPAFEAGKTAIELGERDFRIDHRQKPRRPPGFSGSRRPQRSDVRSKGFSILPSQNTSDYMKKFIGASEPLVSRTSIRVAS